MHHHHAVALLLFSIVFAAFALFTLCTFAPKVSGAAINNPVLEEQSIESLAGLPIRRRSQDDAFEGLAEKNGEAPLAYTPTLTLMKSDASIVGTDAMRPETIKTYPISRLLQVIEQGPLQQDCPEHMNPAEVYPFPSLAGPTSQDLIERTSQGSTVNDKARNIIHKHGDDADLLLGGSKYARSNTLGIEDEDGDRSYVGGRSSGSESDIIWNRRWDLLLTPDSGCNKKNNNIQQIDFDMAQRVANSAGLAAGFLIETEYLTPGRKTVQRMATGLKTRMAENIGYSDPETIIDDTLFQHDVQDIPSYVLQGSTPHFAPIKSIAPPHFELS